MSTDRAGSAANINFLNRVAATGTILTRFAIYAMLQLKMTRTTILVPEGIDCRTTGFDGGIQDSANGSVKLINSF